MDAKSSIRRHDLDWLRVFAILSVFIYHSTRFFNTGDWHVKNAHLYQSVEIFEQFVAVWMMPLIFLISGASIFYALSKGGARKFFMDKVLRLLVPLAVVAFTHGTLQVYLERVTHGSFHGSYFQFLPHIFNGIYLDIGSRGNFPILGMHMWYVAILFLFILLFYPLFRWLQGSGGGVLAATGAFLALPGAIYLLGMPTLILEVLTGDTFLGEIGAGGWSFVMYIPFFLAGFLIVTHPRLQERIRSLRWLSLVLGMVLIAVYMYFDRNANQPRINQLEDTFNDPLLSFGVWCWLLAFLGFAMRHLAFSNPFLKYANEAVLPFYILHQSVLLVVGYFVVRWQIPDFAKWLVIAPVSFALIVGIYEYLVRRNNLMRFLFGMKPVRAAPALQPEKVLQVG